MWLSIRLVKNIIIFLWLITLSYFLAETYEIARVSKLKNEQQALWIAKYKSEHQNTSQTKEHF